jgi:lipoprotein signal peptidase
MSQLNCAPLFPLDPISYVAILSLLLLLLFLYKRTFRCGLHTNIAFILIILGGSMNIGERLLRDGCVLDYIPFFGLFMFNLPDILVMAGIGYLALNIVQFKKEDLSDE